ncbi:hypothetical protein EB796_002151 [Bugula neritina]|uniref:Uncharacterized protein n=1 Tax=Bugula neritina TaxID=10212 RepID=A0A7J7KMY9_BUGNE|nr:hypothetical protein EB796_002151 [Bugula neritina]
MIESTDQCNFCHFCSLNRKQTQSIDNKCEITEWSACTLELLESRSKVTEIYLLVKSSTQRGLPSHKVSLCHENLKQSVSTGNIKTKRVNLSIQIVKIIIRIDKYADKKYKISAKTMKSNLHN